jgi:hypothetical protein
MDQSELLKLARASLKKKGRSRKRGAARALARGEAPTPTPSSTFVEDGRTDNVESAISRIEALDKKLEKLARVEEAERVIEEAEARVLTLEPVDSAEETVEAMDRHIKEEHEFATFDAPQAATLGKSRSGPAGKIREAFRLHLLLGPPKSLDR